MVGGNVTFTLAPLELVTLVSAPATNITHPSYYTWRTKVPTRQFPVKNGLAVLTGCLCVSERTGQC